MSASRNYYLLSTLLPFDTIFELVFQLDQASLGLSREYLNRGFSDKLVLAYYDYMVDVATLLGADRARAELELKESLQFEMKLANVSHN